MPKGRARLYVFADAQATQRFNTGSNKFLDNHRDPVLQQTLPPQILKLST